MNRYILKLRYWLIDKLDPKENKCAKEDEKAIKFLKYFIRKIEDRDCIQWEVIQGLTHSKRINIYTFVIELPEKDFISL